MSQQVRHRWDGRVDGGKVEGEGGRGRGREREGNGITEVGWNGEVNMERERGNAEEGAIR